VRVTKATLDHNHELLLGSYRYRFDVGGAHRDVAAGPPGTRKIAPPKPEDIDALLPALVLEAEPPERVVLKGAECWIGRGADCEIQVNDPMLSPKHAKLRLDHLGRLEVVNNNSRNGIWIRISHVDLGSGAQFQIGEQRFAIRIP
jgi:hypothetical protein